MKYILLVTFLFLFSCSKIHNERKCNYSVDKKIQFRTTNEIENYVLNLNKNSLNTISEIYILNNKISNKNLVSLLLTENLNKIISIETVSGAIVFGKQNKSNELVIIIKTCQSKQ